MLTYLLGIEEYEKEIRDRLDRLEGFDVRHWDGAKQQASVPAGEAGSLKRKASENAMAEHVEHVGKGVNGPSEAAAILRPATST